MINRRHVLALAASLAPAGVAFAAGPAQDGFAFSFQGIDGGALPLSHFRGRAVLVVNTASECGYTGQYEGLQALWTRYRSRGLTVVGVPSNNFGGQEPGSNAQIQSFCKLNYGVDFPLASRTEVVGAQAHPFYAWAEAQLGRAARPQWNFHKILLARDGRAAAAFPSAVAPNAPPLIQAIEAALG